MRIFIIALIQLFVLTAAAPQDSLWYAWKNEAVDDSTRLTALHKYVKSFLYHNPDSAISLATLELEYAHSIKSPYWSANALNLLGGAYWIKGDYTLALDQFYRALDIRINIKDSTGVAAIYNNIGNIFYTQGYYTRALEHYFKSLEIEEALSNITGLANSYLNIGSLYARLDEQEKGRTYFLKALRLHRQLDNSAEIGSIYHNLGNIHQSQGNLDSAEFYFSKSFDYLSGTNDQTSLSVLLGNMAGIAVQRNRFDEALEYFKQSETIRNQIGDKQGIARLLISRGKLYLEAGSKNDAREQCLRGLELARDIHALQVMYDACQCLYSAYKASSNNEMALKYFIEASSLEDSLAKEDARKQLQLLEFQRQVSQDSIKRADEKARAQLLFEQTIRKEQGRRRWFALTGIALLLLSGLLLRKVRLERRSKKKLADQKARADKLLLNVLPAPVAKELLEKGRVIAREFNEVTVLFTDFIKYSEASGQMQPHELVNELDVIYQYFDTIVNQFGVEKIKTIGDAYMAAGGIPVPGPDCVKNTILTALEMQRFIRQRKIIRTESGQPAFGMRVGIHTGSVVAGILGTQKFQYDIWGETVNIANRIEKAGMEGKVIISNAALQALGDTHPFIIEPVHSLQVGEKKIELFSVLLEVNPD